MVVTWPEQFSKHVYPGLRIWSRISKRTCVIYKYVFHDHTVAIEFPTTRMPGIVEDFINGGYQQHNLKHFAKFLKMVPPFDLLEAVVYQRDGY